MKVRRYKASDQNEILTGMLVSSEVLGKIYHRMGKKAQPFRNRWCNRICAWSLEHYSRYRKAPRGLIQNIFDKYAQQNEDEDGIELMEHFLASLSDKYKALSRELNAQYIVDLASKHFELVMAEKKAEAITEATERDDLEAVREAETKFKPTPFATGDYYNPFASQEADDTLNYYEDPDRSIIKFRGAMGEYVNDAFEREGFVAFVGTEKKGKSYWLMETAWQALRQRRKVLYYCLGDMSRRQFNERLYRRICLRPRTTRKVKFPKRVTPIPPAEKGEHPTFKVKTIERTVEGVTRSAIKEAKKKVLTMTASKQFRLRVICKGADVISASDVEADIREMTAEGWVPDIVIIDYADLLRVEETSSKQEFRHQINASWKVLRRISLDYHLLMIVATQAAASNYSSWLLKKKDFSEDKRKNAHVTGMLGLNQTPDEHKAGVYRLNWVFLRDGYWSETSYVWTAGNLALAAPCLKSSF